jgi:phytoene dehydrogenase-like protein
MTDSNRVIVIGAGHNGLVCAAYLAKAGKDVVVVEAAEQVGGAAVTTEFAPGFKISACAHFLNLLDSRISRELGLESHGLRIAKTDLATIALANDGNHVTFAGPEVSGGGVSDADRIAFVEYRRRMHKFGALLGRLHNVTPPRLATSNRTDLISSAKLVLDIRRLGKQDMREFLRIAGINIFDILEETFDHPLLKGALSLDGVLGTNLGPRSNNSVFAALHRMSGQIGGRQGALALPGGGMGSVTTALAAAAQQQGATIRTACPVARILLDGDRVSGVELAGGERLEAGAVVSNADPQTTFFKLLGARHLEAGFMHRIQNLRMGGKAAKLHLALNGLPDFTGVTPEQSGERLVIAPDLVYVEHAFDHSKYGEHSVEPVLEISIPSVHDDTVAPAGQHVLSAIVQYAPYDLTGGWETSREGFLEKIMTVLSQYSPNIREQVIHSQLLTPVDIEAKFGMTGGHWHHGELALDQALMLRPVPGAAQYAAPVSGLYLCGAGCHPGGGVMGSAGHNAAAAVLSGSMLT